MLHGAEPGEVVFRNGDRFGIGVKLDVTVAIIPAQQPSPRMNITFGDYLITHNDNPTLIETSNHGIEHNVVIRISRASLG